MRAVVLAVLAGALTALAQGTNEGWNFTSAYTPAQKVALAQGAIDVFTKAVFPASTMAGAVSSRNDTLAENSLLMLRAIARKDYVASVQDNKAYVTGELGALLQNDGWYLASRAGYSYAAAPRLRYALACIEAFRTYGGDELHQKARDLWSDVQQLQVTSADIASGKHNGTAFLNRCYGDSVLGAVAEYWPLNSTTNVSLISAGSASTTQFLMLSARLAHLEPVNTTFYNATVQGALLAEQFREQTLARFGSSPGCALIHANIAPGKSCLIDPTDPDVAQGTSSDCSTWFAEGLAVLDDVSMNFTRTQEWNQQLSHLLYDSRIREDGVLDDSIAWGSTGALTVVPDSISTKYDFLLSLSEACNYTSPNSGVKISLETFATVQLNALMANATRPGSNVYGNWSGPPADTPTLNGMSAAITALVAAIGTLPTPWQEPESSGPELLLSPRQIAGVICAGVVLLASGVVGVLWRRRRRRQRAQALMASLEDAKSETRIVILNEKQHTAMVWGDQTPVSLASTSTIAAPSSSSSPAPSPLVSHLPSLLEHTSQDADLPVPPGLAPQMVIGLPEPPEDVFRKEDPNFPESLENVFRKDSPESSTTPEPSPPLPPPGSAPAIPEHVQQLLRRADEAPSAHAADLRRRLTELGPIPEVLEALQDLLQNHDTSDGSLPRYEQAAQGNG